LISGAMTKPLSSTILRSMSLAVFAAAVVTFGCGPRPIVGGTPGVLRAGGQPLAEVQVTLHQQEGSAWLPVGFADTAGDGSFELVSRGAAGPLVLSPGEYRATLESVGSPIHIPPAYAKPDSSPLTVSWSAGDDQLDLHLTDQNLMPQGAVR
jgi:hypothetical protein